MKNYEIEPGVRELSTPDSTLYVVSRRVSAETPRDITFNTVIEPLGEDQAWVSVLYRPERLGALKLWRDVPRLNPLTVATEFEHQLARPQTMEYKKTITRLAQISLMAASGNLVLPKHDSAVDTLVRNAQVFDHRIRQPLQLHTAARGVLQAHLKRRAAQQVSAGTRSLAV